MWLASEAQVVELHQAVAEVDVGLFEFESEGGLDGPVEALPFGFEPMGIGAELGVEQSAAAGGRHQFEAVDGVLHAGVLFDEVFYFHCVIFITS